MKNMSNKRGKERNNNFNRLMVLAIATILLGIAVFLWYISRNSTVVIKQNEKYILNSSVTAAKRVDDELINGEILIYNLAQCYAHILGEAEESDISELLLQLNEKTLYDRIVYITSDGINHSIEGEANVKDREYFVEGMNGNTGMQWLSKSRITGKSSIIFYSPLQYEGKIVGVLAGHFEKKHMDSILHTEFMGVYPETILMDDIGMIIASSGEQSGLADYGNLFRGVNERNEITDISEITVKNILIENRNKSFEEKEKFNWDLTKNHETTILSLVPLENHGWYVVQVLPSRVTKGMTKDINRSGVLLTLMLVFMFVIVSTIIYYIISKQNEELKEAVNDATEKSKGITNKLRKAYKIEKQYREAIIASSKLHYSVNLTKDIVQNELIEVVNGKTKKILSMIGMSAPCSYSEMITNWEKKYVEDELKPEFLKHHDRSYLIDRFRDGYRDIVKIWHFRKLEDGDVIHSIIQNIYMTENEDGDILALVVLKDMK